MISPQLLSSDAKSLFSGLGCKCLTGWGSRTRAKVVRDHVGRLRSRWGGDIRWGSPSCRGSVTRSRARHQIAVENNILSRSEMEGVTGRIREDIGLNREGSRDRK